MGEVGSPFARGLSSSPSALEARRRRERAEALFLATLEKLGWRSCVGGRAAGPPSASAAAVLLSTKSARVVVIGPDGAREYTTVKVYDSVRTWPERLARAVDAHVRTRHQELQAADQVNG